MKPGVLRIITVHGTVWINNDGIKGMGINIYRIVNENGFFITANDDPKSEVECAYFPGQFDCIDQIYVSGTCSVYVQNNIMSRKSKMTVVVQGKSTVNLGNNHFKSLSVYISGFGSLIENATTKNLSGSIAFGAEIKNIICKERKTSDGESFNSIAADKEVTPFYDATISRFWPIFWTIATEQRKKEREADV
ncbi:MAG: hypothetical protein AB7P49_11465 [Bdellovibrionales bacterium]